MVLCHRLHEQARDQGIRIEYAKKSVGAEAGADRVVRAFFEDGSQASGDVLIGADGVHSLTRRLIDPAAPVGRYVGLVKFGGYTAETVPDAAPGVWHMVFGKRAFFGYGIDNAGGAVWFANVPRAEVSPEERAVTTAAQWQQQLCELFADDRGPAHRLIRAAGWSWPATTRTTCPPCPPGVAGRCSSSVTPHMRPPRHPDRAPRWPPRTAWCSPSACAICPMCRAHWPPTNGYADPGAAHCG